MRKHLIGILTIFLSFPLCAQNLSVSEVNDVMFNAFKLNKEGKYQEALDSFLEVGKNTKERRTSDERSTYIISQTMAVMCYERLKQYENGFILSKQLLKENLTEKERTDVSHNYVMTGYFHALSYLEGENKNFSEARCIFDEIIPFANEKMRSLILHKISLSWYFEGSYAMMELKYEEALSCMNKAQEGWHDQGRTSDEIDALSQIGTIKGYQNEFGTALDFFRKAKQLSKQIQNDEKLISVLKEEREMSLRLGDTETSISLDKQMDSVSMFSQSERVRYEYNKYRASEFQKQRRYRLAEEWYKKNESYVNNQSKKNIWANKYSYYHSLYTLYANEGNADKALEYAKKTLDSESYAANNRRYYMSYVNIAHAYRMKKDSVNCFRALDSLFMSINRFDEPREIKMLYEMRGLNYNAFGRYDLGLKDYQKADEVLASKYGENDGDRVQLIALIAGCEYKLGNYSKSELLYKKYAEKVKLLYGESSPAYTEALIYLANIEGFAGHVEEGCKTYITAASRMREYIKKQLPFYTADEREHFWEPLSKLLNDMTPYALEAKETQSVFTEACYESLVLTKAFLLESERSTYEIIKKNGTNSDLHDFTILSNLRGEVKKMEKNYMTNTERIIELSSRINTLERRLADKCRSYGNITSFIDVGYNNVKNALNENDVLIDFTDFVSESRGRVYTAYFVEKTQKHPILKELFTENAIESFGIKRPDQFYEKTVAKELIEKIWNPFKGLIKEGATVYYVPSQLLFQIALESLPMEDGTFLGDHYHFVRLSSAREVMNINPCISSIEDCETDAVLYGGLKYDLSADEMKTESEKYEISSLLATRGDVVRGDSVYRELPRTKEEVIEIEKILKSKGKTVKTLTGVNGTEESFLDLYGKAPQILQIATHGFYYTPDAAQKVDYLRGYTDAMLLSGIILSGGNAAWRGKELPKGVLGGVLTASSISRVDLAGAELVVLSACQTGRGEATPEGLFGLQRAFKKAGAQTLVLSLWKISDKVAKEFMVDFYKRLADNGWQKQKAFNDAKKYIRGKYEDPYYWAGFVMLD